MLHAPRPVPIPPSVRNDVQLLHRGIGGAAQDQKFGVVIKCKQNIGDLLSQTESGACPQDIPLRKMSSR